MAKTIKEIKAIFKGCTMSSTTNKTTKGIMGIPNNISQNQYWEQVDTTISSNANKAA